MRTTPVTYFQLWNSGFFNQLLSLEVACGLHAELSRPTILGLARNRSTLFHRPASRQIKEFPWLYSFPNCSIFDFIQGVPASIVEVQEVLPRFGVRDSLCVYLDRTVIELPHQKSESYKSAFLDGRNSVAIENLKQYTKDITVLTTIAWYSRVFLGRTAELIKGIHSLELIPEITSLAHTIATGLSKFNGAHLRCTDFPERIYQLDPQDVRKDIASLCDEALPVVISSDEWEHQIPSSIMKNFGNQIIPLERHILTEYQNEFRNLSIPNHVTLAVLTNSILGYSSRFKGTPGSTFTGYIHRHIALKGGRSWDFFGCNDDNPSIPDIPSWVGSSLPARVRNWWREWPEFSS